MVQVDLEKGEEDAPIELGERSDEEEAEVLEEEDEEEEEGEGEGEEGKEEEVHEVRNLVRGYIFCENLNFCDNVQCSKNFYTNHEF